MTGREELRDRIAWVLYQRWTPPSEWDDATAPGVWLSDADAVLDALGLEQVGWAGPGTPFHGDDEGCDHHLWGRLVCEPVYRLRGES